jgi:hypothetical protein
MGLNFEDDRTVCIFPILHPGYKWKLQDFTTETVVLPVKLVMQYVELVIKQVKYSPLFKSC